MSSGLYSFSYIRNPCKPATTMEAISGTPLKSEQHPLALFQKTNKKSINAAWIMPSLIVLSAEPFTPKQHKDTAAEALRARLQVPTIIMRTTSESSGSHDEM